MSSKDPVAAAANAEAKADEKKGSVDPAVPPLEDEVVVRRHIQWFATEEGHITEQSMKAGHDKMNITSGVGIKITAILSLLSNRFPDKVCKKLPFTIDDLLTVVNLARLGLWTDKGKYNDERFHELMKLFHPVVRTSDGKADTGAIRDDFKPELDKLAQKIPKDRQVGTTVYKIIGVTWKAVTSGSIDELVKYWSNSYVIEPKTGKKVAAITSERMKQFYADGGWAMFTERSQKVAEARAKQKSAKTKEEKAAATKMLAISTDEQFEADTSGGGCHVM
jgi:hypothetical protein